ncbi:hypothetical protein SKAU_G00397520 [Synaphobranchus kaupii]|uniref:Uncharacterized protein n=1 Tax=Synaphobranchus kaupii TaxID=118154 RepID=A0A9Q1E8C5_SYNKA|nr:hypothetical protein SKAU_G00397520 [Synaphobranchus kaupii]
MSTTLNTFYPQSPSIITDQPRPFASNHAFKEVESILTLSFGRKKRRLLELGAAFCTLPNQWNHKLFAKNLHLSRNDTSCSSTVTQYYNRTKIGVDPDQIATLNAYAIFKAQHPEASRSTSRSFAKSL